MNKGPLADGTLLRQNSYRVERVLGQGGFGITYLATDLTLDKKVAIKEFFPKDYCVRNERNQLVVATISGDDIVSVLKQKFLKEAKKIARLENSPYIIKIYAAFEENETAYYVMEYIEGESLSEMVARVGPLPVDWAVGYIRHIGSALQHMHDNYFNHLDVKPANVMIRWSDLTAVLIDFGLSKEYVDGGQETSMSPMGVSHGFAPIEQYRTDGITEFSPQTDIYSLAATLYFSLTGIVPPQAPVVATEGLTMPENMPVHLISTVSKAMSTSRKTRHGSVNEFLSAISAGEQSETVLEKAVDDIVHEVTVETPPTSEVDETVDSIVEVGETEEEENPAVAQHSFPIEESTSFEEDVEYGVSESESLEDTGGGKTVVIKTILKTISVWASIIVALVILIRVLQTWFHQGDIPVYVEDSTTLLDTLEIVD